MNQKEVFAKNLRHYMKETNTSGLKLGKELGVSAQMVYSWTSAAKFPRMDKIDKMAKYFGITKADLLEDITASNEDVVDVIAYKLKHDEGLLALVLEASKLNKEQVACIKNMIAAFNQ